MTGSGHDIRLNPFTMPLATPIATARGTVFDRTGVVIVVTDNDGSWGRGEVAPLPGWSSCSLEELQEPLQRYASSPDEFTTDVPELAAGIDTAEWSLQAAQQGVPLWALIAAVVHGREPAVGERATVAVNALAVGSTPQDLAEAASHAVVAGYGCIKAKLGMGDDLDRIAALADVVPANVSIRLDANSALTLTQASRVAEVAALRLGERLEYVEDPVQTLDEMAQWSAVGVPGAVDELVRTPRDLKRVISEHLAQFVVVKPPMVGGISPAIDMVKAAASANVSVVFSSLYDGPVGLSAWCHLAAGAQPDVVHGLGTAALFAPGGADQLLPYRGRITL